MILLTLIFDLVLDLNSTIVTWAALNLIAIVRGLNVFNIEFSQTYLKVKLVIYLKICFKILYPLWALLCSKPNFRATYQS